MRFTLSARKGIRLVVPVFILSLTAAGLAQTGAELLLKPAPASQPFEIRADASFFNGGHTAQSDYDFRLGIYQTSGRYRFAPQQPLGPMVGYNLTYLDLHTSHPGLPSHLVDGSVGFGMAIGKLEPWWIAASVGVGYAGNSPFSDAVAWYGKANVMFGREWGNGILLVVLDYDGNRAILPDIPLPGVAYKSKLSENLSYVVGIPYSSVTWQPLKELTLEANYAIPSTLTGRATYNITPAIAVYGALEHRQDAFHIDGAPNTRRLFFEQYRFEAGVRWNPMNSLGVMAAAGYAFGQEFNTGFDTRRLRNLTDVSDEPYVRLMVEFRR